jgi:hypothetical protein
MKVQVRGEPDRMVHVSTPIVLKNQIFTGRTECNSGRLKGGFSYRNRYLHIPGYHRSILVSLNYETDIVVAYGRE